MALDPATQMREGPWLDRLFPIRMHDGRMVSVKGFSVLPSNIGILEGGLSPVANDRQRKRLVAIAKKSYGEPLVELEPLIEPVPELSASSYRARLPWMACIALLCSAPLDPEMVRSELTLLWWQDAFTLPLPREIERAAFGIDWARSARDVDLP